MGIRFTACILLSTFLSTFGQTRVATKNIASEHSIQWTSPRTTGISDEAPLRLLSFTGASYSFEDSFLPRYYMEVPLSSSDRSASVRLVNAAYEPLSSEEISLVKDPSKIPAEVQLVSNIAYHKKKPRVVVTCIPLRRNNATGKLEKLVSFDLELIPGQERSMERSLTFASNSVLQNGNWHRIAIANDGVYRMDYNFLQTLGIDMAAVDPQNIRVYGNGGDPLPAKNNLPHDDDLLENAILVEDGGDGSFGPGDYVLFYGRGPHRWSNSGLACTPIRHKLHQYSDSAYYFINTDLGPGKRIQTQASSALPPSHTVTSFDDYAYRENENVNFIKSGNQWFGEYFENVPSYNFSFTFPNLDVSSPVSINARIASRYVGTGATSANYSVSCQSGSTSINIAATTVNSYSPYAIIESGCFTFTPSPGSVLTVNVTKNTSAAVAWLDYIQVNARRLLTMSGNQMIFRDYQSVGAGNVAQYTLNSPLPVQVWDVTDPANVLSQAMTGGPAYQFAVPSDTLHEFLAFNGSTYLIPTAMGAVANQNLHGISQKDYVIVVHPNFYEEALQLAALHEDRDTLSTVVVTPQQIYNEFSSGAQDPVAIRQFVKMFYDRASTAAEQPKYLLLFGDGSFDNRHRYSSANTNFIPTYQSDNSTGYIDSYVSDDYFGLLDDTEGVFNPGAGASEIVDIGIGRFPVKTKTEAQTAVNKILYYTKTGVPPTTASSSSCEDNSLASPYGDWRNMLSFIADDENGGLHQGNTYQGADQLAKFIDTTYNDYNIEKIYLDAYPQIATPGGERYPDVTTAINNRMEKGCLIMNYTGHGGEVGLAHERIVEVPQINRWENLNNMPLFFTATCEFSRYDDPDRTSAGEYVFLNAKGGGIALFTTVRLVYASPNFTLNMSFYEAAFEPLAGRMPRLGDLYVHMKSTPDGYSPNGRNFTLLGDPALTLAYPRHEVLTDSINDVPVSMSSSDTLKALALVTVSGHLENNSGSFLGGYNGILYPTVYDKSQNITTLSNDGPTESPAFTFKVQKNILYKGKVSVVNGRFKFSFIVPKDIAYAYGIGRISYYAENGTEDANGFYEKVVIGGSSDSADIDNTGPEVSLYLNDNKFVFGGMTDENPDLFALLKDEHGVNTVGNGIGHDITAVLDADTDNAILLNDYYQADLNSYKSGSIRYPFDELTEGSHSLTLKVWDVYNNSSKAYTEFVVAKSAELALSHVLNYPNPFTTKTQFFFEQNRCCQTLEVELQVFTISGKLVKNISKFVQAEGYRSDPIEWDGRDDFGDKIGRGVYIYKLKVKTDDGSAAEKFEKLVILN